MAEITSEKRAYDAGWKIGRQRGGKQAAMAAFDCVLSASAKEDLIAEMFNSLTAAAQQRLMNKFAAAAETRNSQTN